MATKTPEESGFRLQDRIVGRRPDGDPVIRLEIYGILILAFAIILLLALVTFDPLDVTSTGGTRGEPAGNAIGPIGAHVADLFLSALGLGAFVLAAIFGWLGLSYIVGRRWHITRADVLGWLGLLLGGAVTLHVMLAPLHFLGHTPGGLLGEYVGEVSRALLSTTGTLILSLVTVVVSVIAVTRRSVFELAALLARGARAGVGQLVAALRHGDAADEEEAGDEGGDDETPRAERTDERSKDEDKDEEPEDADDGPAIVDRRPQPPTTQDFGAPPEEEPDVPEVRTEPAEAREEPAAAEEEEAAVAREPTPDEPAEPAKGAKASDGSEAGQAPSEPAKPTPLGETTAPADADEDVRIVESAAMRRSRDLVVGEQMELPSEEDEEEFELPTLSFLDYKAPKGQTYDRELLRENAQKLEAKLSDYKVDGRVVEIHPGPVVTMYEFKPAPGVKISKIANLSDDLAMALSALRIRIVAPIPGKDVVGIEVPNKTREIVWLKENLSDASYARSKSMLSLALGKDIVGTPTSMNLAKAPHLLVAGATGAGKSVAINSFICSLLYKATPEQVRMIMIDPKMLELSIYDGIPHLLLPVVTDPKQAATALRWAVKEMERRYKRMADLGVRNLDNYNKKVEKLLSDPDAGLPDKLAMAKARREARGEEDPEGVVLDTDGEPLETLPYTVVLIDELADLMMVAGKDVELCIARLAQMARAAGIHLILATQRPSVDVITGLIKANFPTRISFRVSSKVDSRTILDQGGAENLLGMGDMLYLAPGASAPKRVHGCFVSEEEVHLIVRHLKDQGEPDYQLGILDTDDDVLDKSGDDEEYDELYDHAVRIVAETQNASISFLQRKLKIGYNRSARIVEKMEEEGIVGPSDGTSRPRDVFIDPI
ncbi:MAG: DNA translocase FtsK 4TM domain-containing protein [Myxococcota bacterium]